MRWIGWTGGGIVVAFVSLLTLQVVSLRTGWKPGVTAIRRFNRRFMHGREMRTAGQPGAYASIIRHAGRKSGIRYETPVGVVDTDHGLIIALPYGTSPDWLKNVVAAGGAELVYEGKTLRVEDPEVVPAAKVTAHAGRVDRFLQRLYGVDQALRLRKAKVHMEG